MSADRRNVLSLKRQAASREPALSERLHKVLATAGLGSRRALEARIEAGEITVNGEVASLGNSVSAGDLVQLDGRQFVVATDHGEDARVLVLNKAEGMLTTRDDPEGRPTIFEHLDDPRGKRWIAVGRLDMNTTGLLLLTTDGALAHALMHPAGGIEREYLCRVQGETGEAVLARLRKGVELEDGPARFEEIISLDSDASHAWFRVVLREGRNREVRRMWQAVDCEVSRLKRIRYGSISLPRQLGRGESRELDAADVAALRKLAGIELPEPTLTLKQVSRQRRGQQTSIPIKPEKTGPAAWTGSHRDEARELSAWDRPRPERSGRPPRRAGGKEVNGNLLRPDPDPAKRRKSRRKAAPGEELPAVRSWFAGDGQGRDNKRPGKPRPGNKGTPPSRPGAPRNRRPRAPGNRRGPGSE